MSRLAALRRLAALVLLSLWLAPLAAQNPVAADRPADSQAAAADFSSRSAASRVTPPFAGAATNGAPIDESHAVKRLLELQQQIAEREREAGELRQMSRKVGVDALDPDSQKRLSELPKQIQKLRESFEQIAVSGLDLSIFAPEAPKEYQWQSELLEIVRPLISGLKELTEKPRRIEFLRQELDRTARQSVVIDDAIAALARLTVIDPPESVARNLAELRSIWDQRRAETHSNLEVLEFKLATLQGQTGTNWSDGVEALQKFGSGRGATLGIAFGVALGIWLAIGALIRLLMRLTRSSDARANRKRERALLYLSRAVRALIIVAATLMVFYVRSDVLLLALSLVALFMAGAGLRQAIPRYIAEINILLDFGPVREGERIIHNGIPMQIRSIHAFAKLANPELDGVVRLPLYRLTELLSRPTGCQDESWFPTRPGETVQFADKRMAEVLSQSVDIVQLRMRGSLVTMSTRDFMAANPLNLSREGFLVIANFGIDYRHQAICLTEVPAKMTDALQAAIGAAEYGEWCRNVVVEFNAAGTNSLDYLIILPFDGAAVQQFHTAGRLIQRTLVALCNQERWTIPFGQLTIHQGEGFERLRPVGSEQRARSGYEASASLPADAIEAEITASGDAVTTTETVDAAVFEAPRSTAGSDRLVPA